MPVCFPSAYPPSFSSIPSRGLRKSLVAGPTEKANDLVCAPIIPRPLHSSVRKQDPLQPAFPMNPTSYPSPLSLLSLPTLSLSLLSSFSHTYFLLKPKQNQTLYLTCYYSSHSSTPHLPFPATLLDSVLPTCRHPAFFIHSSLKLPQAGLLLPAQFYWQQHSASTKHPPLDKFIGTALSFPPDQWFPALSGHKDPHWSLKVLKNIVSGLGPICRHSALIAVGCGSVIRTFLRSTLGEANVYQVEPCSRDDQEPPLVSSLSVLRAWYPFSAHSDSSLLSSLPIPML